MLNVTVEKCIDKVLFNDRNHITAIGTELTH